MGIVIANVRIEIDADKWDNEEMKQEFAKNIKSFVLYGLEAHAGLLGTEVIVEKIDYEEY